MNQYKAIFLGTVDPQSDFAQLKRAVNSQKVKLFTPPHVTYPICPQTDPFQVYPRRWQAQ